MQKDMIKKRVLDLINQETGRSYKGLEESCSIEHDLCMDSLEMVGLQIAIEDEFRFEFDPMNDDFEKCFATYSNLCTYVEEKIRETR